MTKQQQIYIRLCSLEGFASAYQDMENDKNKTTVPTKYLKKIHEDIIEVVSLMKTELRELESFNNQ